VNQKIAKFRRFANNQAMISKLARSAIELLWPRRGNVGLGGKCVDEKFSHRQAGGAEVLARGAN
jgi:hypothetical protein